MTSDPNAYYHTRENFHDFIIEVSPQEQKRFRLSMFKHIPLFSFVVYLHCCGFKTIRFADQYNMRYKSCIYLLGCYHLCFPYSDSSPRRIWINDLHLPMCAANPFDQIEALLYRLWAPSGQKKGNAMTGHGRLGNMWITDWHDCIDLILGVLKRPRTLIQFHQRLWTSAIWKYCWIVTTWLLWLSLLTLAWCSGPTGMSKDPASWDPP